MSNIGEKLKFARENKGVTQTQVYKDTGIHNKTLSGYERGISEPDLDTIKILAKYYNVSINFLLNSNEENSYNSFIQKAKEKYGPRGKKQAEELLENVKAMFDGGELPEEDKDEFFRAMTDIYFDSKEKNKKYTPKKYRKDKNNK